MSQRKLSGFSTGCRKRATATGEVRRRIVEGDINLGTRETTVLAEPTTVLSPTGTDSEDTSPVSSMEIRVRATILPLTSVEFMRQMFES
jgi:hypothetical protein